MSRALNALKNIRDALKNNERYEVRSINVGHGETDPEPLLDYLEDEIRLAEVAEAAQRRPVYSRSTIFTVGYDANGKRVVSCSRSSQDPSGDRDKMEGFLELEQAYRLRSVEIKGHKIGSLWVTSNPPENTLTLKADALSYAQMAIDIADAKGQVVTIDLKPSPGAFRMGGYYMVPKVRDNRATVQRKMEAPARIVNGSNYDNEMFCEKFHGEEMPHWKAVLECEKFNRDPKNEHGPIYRKVVPVDYKLYSFEP